MADLQSVFDHLHWRLATQEDTPQDWQVLADALGEAGDARAEEVRLWHQLLTGVVRGPQAVEATRRQIAIAAGRRDTTREIRNHGLVTGINPLSVSALPPRLDPGESLVDWLRPWLDHGRHELLVRLELELGRPTDDHLAEISTYAPMSRVRALELNTSRMTGAAIRSLCDSPHLSLRSLGLHAQGRGLRFEPDTAQAIAAAGWPLERLSLHGTPFDDAAVMALADTQVALRWLGLITDRLRWRTIGHLVASLPELDTLAIDVAEDPGPPSEELPAREGVLDLYVHRGVQLHLAALGEQAWLRAVRRLYLVCGQGEQDELAELLGSGNLSRLETVELDGSVSPEALAALLATAPGLKALRVSGAGLGEAGGRVLGEHPRLSGLERLWLKDTELGPAGAAHLVGTSQSLSSLARLSVWGEWGHPNLVRLAHREDLRPEVLRLYRMGLDDRDVEVLASSPILSGVRVLDLSQNHITVRGLEALAKSRYLTNVERLALGVNPLGPEALRILADFDVWPTLRELEARECGIDAGRLLHTIVERGVSLQTGLGSWW